MVVKRAILVLLAVLLVIALLGSSVAMGLDRGVLNDDYVKDRLDRADAYDRLHAEMLSEFEDELPEFGDDLPSEIDVSQIIEDTITPEFIQEQFEGVIEGFYAFLHGETDTLEVIITVDDLSDNLADAIANQVVELDLADFGIEPITLPIGEEEVVADITQLDQGEEAYQNELDSFEESIKDILREEFEEEFGEEPDEEELDEEYQDLLDELEDDILDAVEAAVQGADLQPELEEAAMGLGETIASAYTSDMTYEEFEQQLDSDKIAIGEAAADWALAELPDDFEEFDVGEEIDEEQLEPVATVFSIIGTLALVLPLISLGLIGLMYVTTRDVVTVGKTVGIVAILVGAIGVAVAVIATGIIEDLVAEELAAEEEISEGILELVFDIVAMVFDPFQTQSFLLLALGGLVLVGAVVYNRHRAGLGVPFISEGTTGEASSAESPPSDEAASDTPDETGGSSESAATGDETTETEE